MTTCSIDFWYINTFKKLELSRCFDALQELKAKQYP